MACFREPDRPKLFFFNLALAETAVLGAFMAQDLALFIVFFDLMLVPFYFLIGGLGQRRPRARHHEVRDLHAVRLAADARRRRGAGRAGHARRRAHLVLDRGHRRRAAWATGTQEWIFLLFALAFLVKAPLFPLHGWVPETYRSTPIVVLALLSGVLSKVGVYGFLRIVMPTMPDAAQHYQELMLVVAVFSILYGSVLAFTQDNVRMVVAYSSIAQLGFIVLGIFSLDPRARRGRVFQMLNHGLVVVPLFLIIGVVAARADGQRVALRARRDGHAGAGAGGAVPDHRLRHAGHARVGELRGRDPRPVRHVRGRTSCTGWWPASAWCSPPST